MKKLVQPIDYARGFDAMRGSKILRHFASYQEAKAYASSHRAYVRYWLVKGD